MRHTWMPGTGGVLILLGGTIEFLAAFIVTGVFLCMVVQFGWKYSLSISYISTVIRPFGPLLIPGILGIIGGVYAIQKRRWLFCLISSLLSFIPFGIVMAVVTDWRFPDIGYVLPTALPFLFGIISMVLVYLSREQFAVSSSTEE